jgi:hypothetical protein
MVSGSGVLTILSNLSFLLAIVASWTHGRIISFGVFIAAMFISATHHACDWFDACLLPYKVNQLADFSLATILVPLTVIRFIYWRKNDDPRIVGLDAPWAETLTFIYFALLTVVSVVYTDGGMISQCIIMGASILLLAVYFVAYSARFKAMPKYEWKSLSIGVFLTLMAVALFELQELMPSIYAYIHSEWHLLAGVGQAWVIISRRKLPRYLTAASHYLGSSVMKTKTVIKQPSGY